MKCALISVSDKQGVVEFARGLHAAGVEILSTGGTARTLRDADIAVIDVSEYTESPEIMDGRVKTLHPRVHGGVLMRDRESDREAIAQIGGRPIDLVCVNLYPFRDTVQRGAAHEEVIENIDIGGPSMLRSAAKNHARVTVVCDPGDYAQVLVSVEASGTTDAALRAKLAQKAFSHTAAYDEAIAEYLQRAQDEQHKGESAAREFPDVLELRLSKAYDLRYGENPHQSGAFYVDPDAEAGSLARAQSVDEGKKQLSFNNLVDVDAALEAVREFEEPAAVVVKHTNPCGVGRAATLADAYRLAREGDPVSAFGGIVALNREVDAATAEIIAETFIECVVAPAFSDEARQRLGHKKNLRLLATGAWLSSAHPAMHAKKISGGLVVQQRDATGFGEVQRGRVVTSRAPSAEEREALDFAWRVCKHVKSNAIVLAKPNCTVGVGAGQMSRVVSVRLAAQKAGDLAMGSVMASDAFFPFADGLQAAAEAGVTAVVQPGGSKRDEEVIAAANQANVAMVLTSIRHFRH